MGTVERYQLIVHSKPISSKTALQAIGACVGLSCMYASCPFFGFGHYDLQPSLTACWARGGAGNQSDQLYLGVSSAIIATTAIGMVIGYARIFSFIKSVFRNSGLSYARDD